MAPRSGLEGDGKAVGQGRRAKSWVHRLRGRDHAIAIVESR